MAQSGHIRVADPPGGGNKPVILRDLNVWIPHWGSSPRCLQPWDRCDPVGQQCPKSNVAVSPMWRQCLCHPSQAESQLQATKHKHPALHLRPHPTGLAPMLDDVQEAIPRFCMCERPRTKPSIWSGRGRRPPRQLVAPSIPTMQIAALRLELQ